MSVTLGGVDDTTRPTHGDVGASPGALCGFGAARGRAFATSSACTRFSRHGRPFPIYLSDLDGPFGGSGCGPREKSDLRSRGPGARGDRRPLARCSGAARPPAPCSAARRAPGRFDARSPRQASAPPRNGRPGANAPRVARLPAAMRTMRSCSRGLFPAPGARVPLSVLLRSRREAWHSSGKRKSPMTAMAPNSSRASRAGVHPYCLSQ